MAAGQRDHRDPFARAPEPSARAPAPTVTKAVGVTTGLRGPAAEHQPHHALALGHPTLRRRLERQRATRRRSGSGSSSVRADATSRARCGSTLQRHTVTHQQRLEDSVAAHRRQSSAGSSGASGSRTSPSRCHQHSIGHAPSLSTLRTAAYPWSQTGFVVDKLPVSAQSTPHGPGRGAWTRSPPTAGVAWHLRRPLANNAAPQRVAAVVDRSHRFVIAISGAERLTWLHTISSQHVADAPRRRERREPEPGRQRPRRAPLRADRSGRRHLDRHRGRPTGPTCSAFLQKMVFWAKAEPRDGNELAVLSLLGPDAGTRPRRARRRRHLPSRTPPSRCPAADSSAACRGRHADVLRPARARATARRRGGGRLDRRRRRARGTWAFEALRVAAAAARGSGSTPTTAPSRTRSAGSVAPPRHGAVHLDKGCYRGQETVARVHNLGKPPRQLVLLHLDGSADGRPEPGDPVTAGGRTVGRSARSSTTTNSARSRWRWSSAPCPSTPQLVAGPCAASIDPDSVPEDDAVAGRPAGRRPAARPVSGRRDRTGRVDAVCVVHRREHPALGNQRTAIDKRPVDGPVRVTTARPGRRPRRATRVTTAASTKAVYAYAEDEAAALGRGTRPRDSRGLVRREPAHRRASPVDRRGGRRALADRRHAARGHRTADAVRDVPGVARRATLGQAVHRTR